MAFAVEQRVLAAVACGAAVAGGLAWGAGHPPADAATTGSEGEGKGEREPGGAMVIVVWREHGQPGAADQVGGRDGRDTPRPCLRGEGGGGEEAAGKTGIGSSSGFFFWRGTIHFYIWPPPSSWRTRCKGVGSEEAEAWAGRPHPHALGQQAGWPPAPPEGAPILPPPGLQSRSALGGADRPPLNGRRVRWLSASMR